MCTGAGTALAHGHGRGEALHVEQPECCAARSRCRSTARRPSLGAPLTVHFRVYRHTDHSLPPLEPVVADEGGPGIRSTGSAATYLYMLGSLHRRHDLIVMDNRGTGLSGAINCPRLQQSIGDFTGGHRRMRPAPGSGGQRLRHRCGGRRPEGDPGRAARRARSTCTATPTARTSPRRLPSGTRSRRGRSCSTARSRWGDSIHGSATSRPTCARPGGRCAHAGATAPDPGRDHPAGSGARRQAAQRSRA